MRVAEVRARASGILLKRRFEEGAMVKEGQLLFEIDPAPLEAALPGAQDNPVKAEANEKQTKSKAVRYQTLVAKNAVSSQENEDAAAAQGDAETGYGPSEGRLQRMRGNCCSTHHCCPSSSLFFS